MENINNKNNNILILLVDQQRWSSLGCYGNSEVNTSNIDKMAKEGVMFTNSISAAPVCSPFRATLQTGLYAHQHGVIRNNIHLNQSFKSLADYFNKDGYETCYIGKAHWYSKDKPGFIPPGERLRWQNWCGHNRGHYYYDTPIFDNNGKLTHEYKEAYEPKVQTDMAMDFIKKHKGDPWLIQLNWGPPHTATMDNAYQNNKIRARIKGLNKELGFGLSEDILDDDREDDPKLVSRFPQSLVDKLVPQNYLDMYNPNSLTLEPSINSQMKKLAMYYYQEYYAMVTSLDDQVKRVMDMIKKTGQDRNTIVIYCSDHGDLLGSHGIGRGKALPYQNAYRTPLIIWGPQFIQHGVVTDALINSVDLLPTILELAGIKPDANLPGVSQAEWCLKGQGDKQKDVLLGLGDWRAIYDGRYFYAIRRNSNKKIEAIHLIDTQNDHYDLKNLLDNSNYQNIISNMHERLFERLFLENDTSFLKNSGLIS